MKNNNKNCKKRNSAHALHYDDGFPLPDDVVLCEILGKLELESLCSLACVCRNLRSMVATALLSLETLDLSAISLNDELLGRIVPRLGGVRSVAIDCLRLDDRSVINVLGPHVQELNLFNCAALSCDVMPSIGDKCPHLRILVLEYPGVGSCTDFWEKLREMLTKFHCLESVCLKPLAYEVRGRGQNRFVVKTVKFLKLQEVNEQDAVLSSSSMFSPFGGYTLLHLSLVLDLISDELMAEITSAHPCLVELDLEDRPRRKPPRDLTNTGLQLLASCQHLTHLSIMRTRVNCPVSFGKVNDSSIMLLSKSCKNLESIKLGGFSKVTDAGFSSLLHSCKKLRKFEVRNAPLLSNLAFCNIIEVVGPLVELKLQSCNRITSEALAELASSGTLEVLDTYGCRRISNKCIDYISCLHSLTSLNLGRAAISDTGLGLLSRSELPLTNLCLRGCAKVTDAGIICLFSLGERIKKTLLSLDVGNVPGISDRAIWTVVSSAEAITELCLRDCDLVTDEAFKTPAYGRSGGSKFLQKLDICRCTGFSDKVVLFLEPMFRGLRWLGVGGTSLAKKVDFDAVCRERPLLRVCFEGCELGCEDGWQCHHTHD